MRYFKTLCCLILLTGILTSSGFAQEITLSWDASPTPEVAGYNVYYKAGNMSFPFDGTEADQGLSPVDVGNSLSTTLTGLTDGIGYYFTVTAYDDSNNESTYSNIVSNTWIPSLLTPNNGATNEPIPVTFQWETAPIEYSVSYTLYYGTDQNEVSNAGAGSTHVLFPENKQMPPAATALLLSGILCLFFIRMQRRSNAITGFATAMTVVLFGGILTACGGGGGGDTTTIDRSASTGTATVDAVLYTIDKASSDYHQAFDLEAGTTYYWKVVATDTNDANLTYVSPVQSFTTETF